MVCRCIWSCDQGGTKRYNMHCGESAHFSDFHRRRLQERAIRCIHLPRAAHLKYRERVEKELEAIAADGAIPLAARAGLIYDMALELLAEWTTGEAGNRLPRLDSVARAAAGFILTEPAAFNHFFLVAQHTDRIATHMANVGFWMACLAKATGTTDPIQLKIACLAGFLCDTGVRSLSVKMLLRAEALTPDERIILTSHPSHGADYLKSHGVNQEEILRVTMEHHERLDGSGYPGALTAPRIHPLSQACAILDSFEAMTAPRPYKTRIKSIAEALEALQTDAAKYHQPTVEAWKALLQQAAQQGAIRESVDAKGEKKAGRRQDQRFAVACPLQLRVLTRAGADGAWSEGPATDGMTRNLSKGGVALVIKEALALGTYVRVTLKGKGTLGRTMEGQVMRCQACQGGHEIGVRQCVAGK